MPAPTLLEARPEVAAFVSPNSPLSAGDVRTTSTESLILRCQTCGRDRSVKVRTLAAKKRGHICRSCAIRAQRATQAKRSVAKAHPKFAKLFADSSPVKPSEVTVRSTAKAVFVCTGCGGEHPGSVAAVFARRENTLCLQCKTYPGDREPERVKRGRPSVATAYPHLVPFLSDLNPIPAEELATYADTRIFVDCPGCGETRRVRLKNSNHGNWSGLCSACSAKGRQRVSRPLAETNPEVAARFADSSPVRPEDVSAQSSRRALFVCPSCDNTFESKIANQTRSFTAGHCGDCRAGGKRKFRGRTN